MTSTFQSYLIIAPNPELAREKTQKLAEAFGIDIEKASTDIYFIKAAKKEIAIEQIRQLRGHIFQKPLQNMYKFVVLENAHDATLEAQNALLKLLEEPPSHAIIVLEAQNKALLLPTILSRVTTKSGHEPKTPGTKTIPKNQMLFEKDLETLLKKISEVENPQEFLDEQIIVLSDLLVKSAKNQDQKQTLTQISKAIEACAQANQMLASNVNPTFVLSNLVFSLNVT